MLISRPILFPSMLGVGKALAASLTLRTVAACGLGNPTGRQRELAEESRPDGGGTRESRVSADRLVSLSELRPPSSSKLSIQCLL